VDDGWRDLLERACARIRKAVSADGGSFRATQIKEKYGSLRFYWWGRLSPGAAARGEEAIDLAEARSAATCEICGEPGRLHGGGSLTTRCAVHAEGRPAVPVDEGFENLHADHRFVGGRWRTRYRFYDRDADRFVEAHPPLLFLLTRRVAAGGETQGGLMPLHGLSRPADVRVPVTS
jgi:hypothetical protein